MSKRTDFSNDRTFLIDLTRCTGCRGCQVACKTWNQLKAEKTVFFAGEGYSNPKAMSEYTYTRIKFRDYEKEGGNEFAFYKEMCMHCDDPACASVCPVFAYNKSAEGPVYYDDERCIGCRFCMVACPFSVPKYEWDKALPLVRKCTGCYSRVRAGLVPACAKACPSAIVYGSRKDMVAEAKRRMAARPNLYVNKIYGLKEAGGTSVLYLSDRAFEELGFKPVTHRPIPELTWQALRFVPTIFLTAAGSLTLVSWLTHRKDRNAGEEGEGKGGDGKDGSGEIGGDK